MRRIPFKIYLISLAIILILLLILLPAAVSAADYGLSYLIDFLYIDSPQTTSLSRFMVIKGPDFYCLIHKEPKMGVKGMDNLARIMSSRFKGSEDVPNP